MNKIKYLGLFFGLTILFSISCKDTEPEIIDDFTPPCILLEIDDAENENRPLKVKRQVLNGVIHYWLNTGDLAFDGDEYIVDAACDTLCIIRGFSIDNECYMEYDPDAWIEIE